jgi:hypothetical protein
MKDALTQRCLTNKQLGRFVSKTGTQRFKRMVDEHVDHCDECWERVRKACKIKPEPEDDAPMMKLLFPGDDDPTVRHVPATRAGCVMGVGARPCPWVGCRHHLWNDEHDGVELRVIAMPVHGAHSCTLDVVDEGLDLTPTEIGRMIQRRPEEVSANLESALVKLRLAGVFLREDTESEDRTGLWESITGG